MKRLLAILFSVIVVAGVPLRAETDEEVEAHKLVLDLTGAPFDAIAHLDFGRIGIIIVGAFVVTWVVSFAVFKLRRVEERWSALVDRPELG